MCDEETREKFLREPWLTQTDTGLQIEYRYRQEKNLNDLTNSLILQYGTEEIIFSTLLENYQDNTIIRLLTIYVKNITDRQVVPNLYRDLRRYQEMYPELQEWCDRYTLFKIAMSRMLELEDTNNLNELNSRNLSRQFIQTITNNYNPKYNNHSSNLLPYLKATIAGRTIDFVREDVRRTNIFVYYLRWQSDWFLLKNRALRDIRGAINMYCSHRFDRYSTLTRMFREHYFTDLSEPRLRNGVYREPTSTECDAMASIYKSISNLDEDVCVDGDWILSELRNLISFLRQFYQFRARNISIDDENNTATNLYTEDKDDTDNSIYEILLEILQNLDNRQDEILMYMNLGLGYSQEIIGYIINRHKAQVSRAVKRCIELIVNNFISENYIQPDFEQIAQLMKEIRQYLPEAYRRFTSNILNQINSQVGSYEISDDRLINHIENYLLEHLVHFDGYNQNAFEEYLYILRNSLTPIIQTWRNQDNY